MEVIRVHVPVRGQVLELDVPGADATAANRLLAQVEMLLLALLALEDSRVDGVLSAFGFSVDGPDGPLFPTPHKDPG